MSEPTKPRRLYLVDGSSYLHRAFHASAPLTTKNGLPTNGLLVFTNMLRALMRTEAPDLMSVVFDPMPPTFRHELYPAYKANRSAAAPELVRQFPYFRSIVSALGVSIMEVPRFEADDVIATVVKRARELEPSVEITIVSADKDLMQLIDDGHVRMLDTMGRENRVFNRATVIERFQVGPERVADVQALAGDSSDNVPGVPGIGIKTAGQLVVEYGDLEGVLASVERISGKKRKESLVEFAAQARLSKQLVTLVDDVPLQLDLVDLVPQGPRFDLLVPLFTELEFHRLLKELQSGPAVTAAMTPVAKLTEPVERSVALILDDAALVEQVQRIRGDGSLAFYLISSSADLVTASLVGIALCSRAQQSFYVPLAHRTLCAPEQLSRERAMALLGPVLEDATFEKTCHDSKFAWALLRRHGVTLRGVRCDTQLASYLIDPSRNQHDLEVLAGEVLRYVGLAEKDVLGSGKKRRTWGQVEVEETLEFAAQRADMAFQLAVRMLDLMKERDLLALYDDIERPLAIVLARMELEGICIDESILSTLSEEFYREMKTAEAASTELMGREVNLNSPKQLSELLFDELKLTPGTRKQTQHGYSTDAASLELIEDQHALPRLILEYRSAAKLRSTYTDALPRLKKPTTGRVHASFNQAVTATGRLSSSDPNLQNIPARTEKGRKIRRAFIPREGWRLLAADYSQIELRLMAHFSKDPLLLDAFKHGEDVHRRTAAEIFDVPMPMVSKQQRGVGKTINFGVLYGMGVLRLAREIEVSRADAKRFMDTFFERFQGVRAHFETMVEEATRDGFVTTLLGRRRYLPELRSSRRDQQSLGQRLAVNTPIQGTAADLMKLAMIRVDRALEAAGLQSKMLLQVHDELVFECPPEEETALAALVREGMERVYPLDVKLVADVKVGANWADMGLLMA